MSWVTATDIWSDIYRYLQMVFWESLRLDANRNGTIYIHQKLRQIWGPFRSFPLEKCGITKTGASESDGPNFC